MENRHAIVSKSLASVAQKKAKIPVAKEFGKAPQWKAKPHDRVEAITEWFGRHIPPACRVQLDENKGRWRVIYPQRSPKPVAWQERGMPAAINLVLYHAWKFHEDHCGEIPPFDIEESSRTRF